MRSAHLHADLDRLRRQVSLSWPREREVLSRLGLVDGVCVLDLGCGPGFVTEELLKSLPASTVVAVDLDPAMSSLVTDRLGAEAAGRLAVINSSGLNIDLEDECIDFALSRFVFQHLASPDLAAAEMYRLLRPGGQFAVIDIDDAIGGIVDPPIPALATLGAKVAQLQANRGGNRYVGRRLWRTLQAVGFVGERVDPILVHSDEIGIEPFLPQFDPERYRGFIAPDGLTEEELGRYRDDFERFLAGPSPYIAHLLLVVSGRKPQATAT